MATKARRKTQMSDDHKAALAVGRTEGRVVRRYLDALEANKPKRGRKRTPDSIQRRLKAIDAELGETDRLNELKLVQERMNLELELASLGARQDLAGLESEFVKVAKAYSARQGISYAAWRAVGRARRGAQEGRRQPRSGHRGQQAGQHAGRRRSSPASRGVARSGMRHQPHHVASARAHTGDVVDRPIGVVDVAEDDLLFRRVARPASSGLQVKHPSK